MAKKKCKKRQWEKPELIVLASSKPEEGVLANCKGGTPSGPENNESNCSWDGGCGQCNMLGAS